MNNFLGGSEALIRTETANFNNKIQEVQLQASKIEKKDTKQMTRLKEVSGEFESIFLSYMLKEMRKTVPEDTLLGKSQAKEIYYDMYDDAMAKELSKAGGIGLAAMLYNQLSKGSDVK